MQDKQKTRKVRINPCIRSGLTVYVVVYRKKILGEYLNREAAEKFADKVQRLGKV